MKRADPLESILGHLDDLDAASRAVAIERLTRERRLLNTVINTLREGILVIGATGVIEYANAAALGLLGIGASEVGTLVLWKAMPDLTRTLPLTPRGELRERRHLTRELELTYPERRFVRLYLVPLEDPIEAEGEAAAILERYAVILTDVSQEHARTQEQLESERINSILQLAAGVAHELGNPLNSLTIHLQVVERQLAKLAASPKLEKSIAICRGEVERLDSIIQHFLEAVRPTPPDLHDLDLIVALEEALEFLGPELESAGVTVDVSLEGGVPVVSGDRQQVKQVFFNVLKNARQAMKDGGVIRVRARADDEFAYLAFVDTGSGIAEEDLAKVFQPYFSTKADGHGLGMMISDRIMREHGGQIGIDSREGVGTVVTLQFPQKHRRARAIRAEEA